MATPVTFNGTVYSVPAIADASWGTNVSTYLIAIASGCLQKTGGSFTLTAEVDFGATYGLKSAYYKSKGTTPSATGIVRLANNEGIGWKNAAGSADLLLKVNSSNVLEFNGSDLPFIDMGAANTVLNVNSGGTALQYSLLSNANITAAAAIAVSKLAALTVSRAVASDASGFLTVSATTSTELGYVNGVTDFIQTQLNAKQNIQTLTTKGDIYVCQSSGPVVVTRLAAGTNNYLLQANSGASVGLEYVLLTNSNVSASAAIAVSKLAALTASRAVVTDGSGFITQATTTATEIGYVNGVTAAIQTQLDAKQARSTLTTKGDLYAATASATVSRVPVGTNGYALVADSAQATGLNYAAVVTNPMDSAGDLIVGGASGTPTKLDHPGAAGYILGTTGTSTTAWVAGRPFTNPVNLLARYSTSADSSSFSSGTTNNVVYSTIIYEATGGGGSNFNTSTGIFTAPFSGVYTFSFAAWISGTTTSNNLQLYANSVIYECSRVNGISSTDWAPSGSVSLYLTAAQTAVVRTFSSGGSYVHKANPSSSELLSYLAVVLVGS